MGQIEGSQASRLGSFRFAGGTPASQDRGRLACLRLYSTANERGFVLNRLFVCLAANCRRDDCVSANLWTKRRTADCTD
ncbi:MAG: hypothetical protein LBP59_02125 [Planctomycetaceae bacterium]|nr:hypothetical protein [Planctomycetaceae bacterium]